MEGTYISQICESVLKHTSLQIATSIWATTHTISPAQIHEISFFSLWTFLVLGLNRSRPYSLSLEDIFNIWYAMILLWRTICTYSEHSLCVLYSFTKHWLYQIYILDSVGGLEHHVRECLPNLMDHEKPWKTFEQRSDRSPVVIQED